MAATVVLDFPARREYVAVVRQVVAIIAGREGHYEPSRVDDLTLAVSEACANSIDAYSDPSGRVVVRIDEHPGEVVVRVEDAGPGIDPAVFRATPVREPSPASERGRGVSLIRELVDEATFESSPEGTSVRMTVRRRA